MRSRQLLTYLSFSICCAVFIYGITLLIEASQPCGSDGCLIHLLYLIAIPILLISGITGYMLGKKLFRKK